MNTPKAIEVAIATVIREFGQIPDGVVIRVWQKLDHDKTWNKENDLEFPLLDVRCSPPSTDDNQATLKVGCAVLVGTMARDDKDHALISELYECVQGVIDRLFSQFRTSPAERPELTRFLALMTEHAGNSAFQFGGFTFGDALSPFDDNGANMMGLTLTVHYGRSDF